MAGDDRILLEEARAIAEAARARGVRLRLLGALAIHLHSEEWDDLARRLDRLGDSTRRFTDLDFAAYGAERVEVRTLLEDGFGLASDSQAMLFHGKERLLYAHPTKDYRVDVFFDRLSFSHTIEFGRPGTGRLDLDFPTLPPADLLLSKLQIHEFTEKDLKDALLLLRSHALSSTDDHDAISVSRVAEPLADDWGFWKDATRNLTRIREASVLFGTAGTLEAADVDAVTSRADALLAAVSQSEKTRSWRKGERKLVSRQWWNDVESVVR